MVAKKNYPPTPGTDAVVQKLRESTEYQEAKKEMLSKLGHATLSAVQAEIDKKSIKKEAEGIAIDEADSWQKMRQERRQWKEDDKLSKKALANYDEKTISEMSQYEKDSIIAKYKEAHNGPLKKFGNFLKKIPVGIIDNIKRTVMISDLKKQAKTAIEETGRIEAGKVAAKRFALHTELEHAVRDENGNQVFEKGKLKTASYSRSEAKKLAQKEAREAIEEGDKEGHRDDSHFVERVGRKAIDLENDPDSAFANDEKVKLKEKDEKYDKERQQVKALYAEYMLAVSKASKGEEGNEAVEKAKKAFTEQYGMLDFNKKKAHYDNSTSLLQRIDDRSRGQFQEVLKDPKANPEAHQAALDAIDEYLENNLRYISGNVQTGLDMKNSAEKSADKAVLRYGALIGGAISLGGMALKSFTRMKIVKAFDTAAGALGIKMFIAGTLGAVAGGIKKGQGQRYEEMRQAIGAEKQGEGDKNHYQKISVADTVKQMRALQTEIASGNDVEKNTNKLIAILGDIQARTNIQAEEKVALMSYESRESIERQKYELLNEIERSKKMLAYDKASDSFSSATGDYSEEALKEAKLHIKDRISAAAQGATEKLSEEMTDVDKVKKGERVDAAMKGFIMAAGVAGVITVASDYVFKGGKIAQELRDFYFSDSGDAAKEALGASVATTTAASTAAAMEKMDNNGGIGVSKGDGEFTIPKGSGDINGVKDLSDGNLGIENKEVLGYKPGAAVIMENKPQGGTALGFDYDGDNKIDQYVCGEGDVPGVNLNARDQYETVRDVLKNDYEIDLQREEIDVTKYNQIAVKDYLDIVDNKVNVKSVILDTDSHDVTFGVPMADPKVDGMTQYVIKVDGAPDGSSLFIDLDGNGKGKVLQFAIEDGQVVVPADVVDTSTVGNNGIGNYLGRATVGRMDGNTLVAYSKSVDGMTLGSTDSLNASVTEKGYLFTAIDKDGETISNFATNSQGKAIENLSEITNGVSVGESMRLPAPFSIKEGLEDHGVLASGEKVPDVGEWKGGYKAIYDSSTNYAFKGNPSLVGTPYIWDANGDGVMNAAEEASYFKQMLVRTATNPYVLGQNASNYGLLEPDVLAKNLFNGDTNAMVETLKAWGVGDGVVDSERDLQNLLNNLMMSENSEYWDKLVNSTINEMQDQLAGGGFEQGTLTDRISTYINKDGSIDTKGNASVRVAMYAYKTDPVTGERIYVGNKGWWVRKWYGTEGGKVADLPLCEQKAVVVEKDVTIGKEESEKENGAKELGEKEAGEKEEGEIERNEKARKGKEGGEKERGQKEVGEKEQGEKEQGEKEIGEKEQGEKEGGDKEQGDKEQGEKEIGEKEQGEKEQGEKEIGEKEQGEKEIGEKEQGEKESGQKEVGEKESGQKEVGDKEVGEKESGQKEVGDKEVGEKESGQKEVGDKEVGEKESGQKEIGDKEVGDKEVGEKEVGEKEIGDKEVGEKEVGEKEVGEKETGGKEGSMNSGDDARPMGTTETPDNMTTATEDNHATVAPAGSKMDGPTSETVYGDNVVTDGNGNPITNPDGETYISTTGETDEEVLQNIQDGTQTTHTTDPTNYGTDSGASQGVVEGDGVTTDGDGNQLAGSGTIDHETIASEGNADSAGENVDFSKVDYENYINNFFN